MFENWQGVNQWDLVTLSTTIKTILNKHENVTNILKTKQKHSKDIHNGPFPPLVQIFY